MTPQPTHTEEIASILARVLEALGMPEESWTSQFAEPRHCPPDWPGSGFTCSHPQDLAPFIDHTVLKADATDETIDHLCEEARTHRFASVCVNTCHVSRCVHQLNQNTDADSCSLSRVCGVVGFPLGAAATAVKAAEAAYVVENGGTEVDMVINIGKLKSGDLRYVFQDILAVTKAAGPSNTVKVILETGLLTREEIIIGCLVSVLANTEFVKTSTGFGAGGATEEHVALMRQVVGPQLGVKASGGIRDAATTIRMIQAGANRIGTSNGVAIVSGGAAAASY